MEKQVKKKQFLLKKNTNSMRNLQKGNSKMDKNKSIKRHGINLCIGVLTKKRN